MSGKGGNPLLLIGSLIAGAAVVGGVSWALKNKSNVDELSDLDRLKQENEDVNAIYNDTLRKAREGRGSSGKSK